MQELQIESNLFETLGFYRMKFLQLLNEGGSEEQLVSCQSAIQHYLGEISSTRKSAVSRQMKTSMSIEKRAGNFAVFFKSLFSKTNTLAKAH